MIGRFLSFASSLYKFTLVLTSFVSASVASPLVKQDAAKILDLEASGGRLAATTGNPVDILEKLSTSPDDPALVFRGETPAGLRQSAQIFRRSVQYTVTRGSTGCTAWFDPFAGVWLIADWKKYDNVWAMHSLGVVQSTGIERAREPGGNERPAMLAASFDQQAAHAAKLFRNAIAVRGGCKVPDATRSATELIGALHRSLDLENGVVELARVKGFGDWQRFVRKAITEPHSTGNLALGKNANQSLPELVRKTLYPVAVAEIGKKSKLVFLQSPIDPAKIVVIRIHAENSALLMDEARTHDFLRRLSR